MPSLASDAPAPVTVLCELLVEQWHGELDEECSYGVALWDRFVRVPPCRLAYRN